MIDFRDRLQAALGDRYRIERELGGGGMSRVFLAEETRLSRQVVIKVLPPATSASIEAGRFEREIQVAASLHHPHIVQLLAAGEGDGVLWYAMPFVEGESLSERLTRGGPLAPVEAMRILREVADALAYAHTRGIVHRDIKPANIMLAGRHALVTDFGVAKAVAAGRRGDQDADQTALTSIGMALGTPAYMAPEQAVADPNVDHRADIYSLGVVAYEMLVGGSPYHATTPQAMLAAHVTQPAEPITARRGDLPPELSAIVMRCLAKAPSDRFATANDLVDALESVGTPASGTAAFDATAVAHTMFRNWHPGRVVGMHLLATLAITLLAFGVTRILGLPDWIWWALGAVMLAGLPALIIASRNERRRAHATMTGMHAAVRSGEFTGQKAIRGGLAALAAVALLAAGVVAAGIFGFGPGATLMTRGSLGSNATVVLAEFDNASKDSTLSGAILEALRVDLGQSSAIHLLQGSDITDALQRMGRPATTPLTTDVARDVAQRANAKAVVTGEIHTLGGAFVLTASIVAAGSGQPLAQVRETAASDQELIAAVNRLSKALRQRIGESLRTIRASESLERVTTASLPALRLYSSAIRATDATDLERARDELVQALAVDSTFAMAWRKLAVIYSRLGGRDAEMVAAARNAYRFRNQLPPIEQHLAEAYYFSTVTRDQTATIAAYRAVLEIDPNDKVSINNLAIQLTNQGKFAEAEALLRHGNATTRLYTHYENLLNPLAAQQKWSALDSVPDEWIRHGGDSAQMFSLRLEIETIRRNLTALDSLTEHPPRSLASISTLNAQLLYYKGGLAEMRGGLARAGRFYHEGALATDAGNPVFSLGADLTQAWFTALQRGKPAEAWIIVEQVLALHAHDSMPARSRPFWSIAGIAALAARPQDVRHQRDGWEVAIPAAERDSLAVVWWDGLGALAAGQWDAAADAFRRVHAGTHCSPCGAYQWAYALDRGGHADSAAAVYTRIIAAPNTDPNSDDPSWYGLAMLRLGEYYQEKGDKAKALDHLQRFTSLWKTADPDLQPKVQEAKRRIAELTAEGRH